MRWLVTSSRVHSRLTLVFDFDCFFTYPACFLRLGDAGGIHQDDAGYGVFEGTFLADIRGGELDSVDIGIEGTLAGIGEGVEPALDEGAVVLEEMGPLFTVAVGFLESALRTISFAFSITSGSEVFQ